MQLCFYPYMRCFRLIATVDLLVLFGCVQFPRRRRVHRTQLPDGRGGSRWLTPPLARTTYRIWQHQPETVEAALAAAGFDILARYGDLDRSPWHPAAKKQVVICRAA